MEQPSIAAVSLSPRHGFSKLPQASIHLLAGLGVEGDAHCGATVQHLYLKRKNAAAPNRMQVHLLQSELFDELALIHRHLSAGQLGENITTRGVDLLRLPLGTQLQLGPEALPPKQRGKAGVMAVVLRGGTCKPGDSLRITLPAGIPHPLCYL